MGTIIILTLLVLAAAFAGSIAMAMRSAANRPWRFELSRVLGDAFSAIARAPLFFVGTVLATTAAPLALLFVGSGVTGAFEAASVANLTGVFGLLGLVWLAFGQFGHLLLVAGTLEATDSGRVDLRRALVRSLTALPAGIAIAILFWIAIAIGFTFFVVPGVFLLCLWFVVAPALIAERTGIFGSFARSAALTSGVRWHLFLLMVVGGIFWLVAQAMIAALVAIFDAPVIGIIVYAGFSALLGLLPPTVSAAAYHSLRTQKEGLRGDDLEQVFA